MATTVHSACSSRPASRYSASSRAAPFAVSSASKRLPAASANGDCPSRGTSPYTFAEAVAGLIPAISRARSTWQAGLRAARSIPRGSRGLAPGSRPSRPLHSTVHPPGRIAMATFILLSKLTDEGAQTLTHEPERLKEVNQELERMGVRVLSQWAVLGDYDFVNV